MDDKGGYNTLISAISDAESQLARLDRDQHKIFAELKSLKTELLKFTNSSFNVTKDTTASPHENIGVFCRFNLVSSELIKKLSSNRLFLFFT